MPITCQICRKDFPSQISNSHLKNHNTTTKQYKELYGEDSLTSDEYRDYMSSKRIGSNNSNFGKKWTDVAKLSMSEKKKGISPWNKGLKLNDTTKIREGVVKREEKYAKGILQRHSSSPSQETKNKISLGVKAYAETHREELSERSHKALKTKISKGMDIAPFRNKKHTDSSKELISIKSKVANLTRTTEAASKHASIANSIELQILETIENTYKLKCQKCNSIFSLTKQYFTESKFKENICKTCYPSILHRSIKETMLFDFVQSLCPDAIANYKFSAESKHEIDIFVPSKNIGIEFNGLYWHSEQVKSDKLADFKKYEKITATGIKQIIVMEDEWDYKREIVEARLKHLLHKTINKLYARKCVVREIDSRTAAIFCEKHHIQGKGRSNVRFGLFKDDELIAVMTFSKSNLSRKISDWELNRFCSLPNISIVGGASKLLTAFETKYQPKTLITYADRRWSNGEVYEILGFSFHSNTSPGYWYFLPNECIRIHRFTLRKNKNDDQSLSEVENRLKQGYMRIWDCGHKKYIKTYS